MKYNLEGKIFASVSNTDNGEVNEETLFHYHQDGELVWADYEGGQIAKGHLIAKMRDDGQLEMKYHHMNAYGELRVGECVSIPIELDDGRLQFRENWEWLTGDKSSGYSKIEEVDGL
jgi:hypothetical protein